jgi:AcrR family transcriptional regulator
MDTSRLGRDDWLRAGRLALLTGGAAAVRIEPLAERLGVTKGSFYWHFTDRAALLEALLREWEEELDVALAQIPPLRGAAVVRELMRFLEPRVLASERGATPSDAAIFAWAAGDAAVARRVNAAEARRVAFFQKLVGDADVGEFLYLTYIGFLMRRRRVPQAAAFFRTYARLSERTAELLTAGKPDVKRTPAERGPKQNRGTARDALPAAARRGRQR